LHVGSFLQAKRDLSIDLMKDSRFKPIPSKGTYFQLMDYSKISKKNDIEFTKWLTQEKKVATVPVSVFYHEKTDYEIIRFCFAKEDYELEEAAKLLRQL
jgi:methionine aminotransferase